MMQLLQSQLASHLVSKAAHQQQQQQIRQPQLQQAAAQHLHLPSRLVQHLLLLLLLLQLRPPLVALPRPLLADSALALVLALPQEQQVHLHPRLLLASPSGLLHQSQQQAAMQQQQQQQLLAALASTLVHQQQQQQCRQQQRQLPRAAPQHLELLLPPALLLMLLDLQQQVAAALVPLRSAQRAVQPLQQRLVALHLVAVAVCPLLAVQAVLGYRHLA
jgi:hypothetical protein